MKFIKKVLWVLLVAWWYIPLRWVLKGVAMLFGYRWLWARLSLYDKLVTNSNLHHPQSKYHVGIKDCIVTHIAAEDVDMEEDYFDRESNLPRKILLKEFKSLKKFLCIRPTANTNELNDAFEYHATVVKNGHTMGIALPKKETTALRKYLEKSKYFKVVESEHRRLFWMHTDATLANTYH